MTRHATPCTQTPSSSQYSQALTSTPRFIHDSPGPDEVCVKLLTRNVHGHREAILLTLNNPIIVGRSPVLCTYVIDNPRVSSIHFIIRVIQSDDGDLIVSCEDVSSNGIRVNRYDIRRTAIILLHDDWIEIPKAVQFFQCCYLFKSNSVQREHLFDTPVVPSNNLRHIGDFIVLPHCLGKGAFAEVHLSLWPEGYMQVACKTIKVKVKKTPRVLEDSERLRKKISEFDKLLQERDILMSLSHPNIIRVFDAVPDYHNNFIHIFMQLCTGGDLFTYLLHHIDTRARLSEGETKYIMFQLFKALSYLHRQNIAHRDLKPENILLYTPGSYPRILLADFGLARPRSLEETFTICGTVAYLPPEAVHAMGQPPRSIGYFGLPGDCWSAGVLMFLMLAGYHPFDRCLTTWDSFHAVFGSNAFYKKTAPFYSFGQVEPAHDDVTTKWRITQEIDFDATEVWDTMHDAKSLVRGLLCEDPVHRYTVEDAMSIWWFQKDRRELEVAYRRMVVSANAPW